MSSWLLKILKIIYHVIFILLLWLLSPSLFMIRFQCLMLSSVTLLIHFSNNSNAYSTAALIVIVEIIQERTIVLSILIVERSWHDLLAPLMPCLVDIMSITTRHNLLITIFKCKFVKYVNEIGKQ